MIKENKLYTKDDNANSLSYKSVSLQLIVTASAGVAAVWLAAGSAGLLSHPLRRILTIIALVIACLAQKLNHTYKKPAGYLLICAAILLILFMNSSAIIIINVMAVALAIAFLCLFSEQHNRRFLNILSIAVAIFGLYRLAYTSVPGFWLAADSAGRFFVKVGTFVTGKPLLTGATFAGIDCIVLMSILWILLLLCTSKPRKTRAIYGFAGILAGYVLYLIILSFAPDIPETAVETPDGTSWSWAGFIHNAVPWNLPVIAIIIQLVILGCILRWTNWSVETPKNNQSIQTPVGLRKYLPVAVVIILAVLLPVSTIFFPDRLSVQGKKIVFYEKGFLNWLKPEHGQYGRLGSGMYGMLPAYIQSLGGSCIISSELSEEDLSDADVLILLFPDEPWKDGQLERIWDFVRNGGSLAVFGEHTTLDNTDSNRFNEVLEPTAIRVDFDCATYAVGGWLQSYEPIIHPATVSVPDDRNQFGVVIGASLLIHWPARPLLIGKWGWSDAGDRTSTQAMMGNSEYDSGEKLGDVILAAEQPMGKGRVIAFGDTSGMTNGINVGSYVFTSRLLGYLAGDKNAQPLWRQLIAVIIFCSLIVLLPHRPIQKYIIVIILCVSASLIYTYSVSKNAGEILPDGNYRTPNNLAYVDSSHLETYSGESWRDDGIGGLMLTLMRNGYMPFSLSDFSAERISKAGLFISIAPVHRFSTEEKQILKDYVNNGGNFILMAGFPEAEAAEDLLSDFGFSIGQSPADHNEPVAMGFFKSPYLSLEDKQVFVRFYAGWPVYCSDTAARVIAYGKNNLPVIIMRTVGNGKVTVIGDTCFAMNKNLEWESGEAFEGMRENADFWRWFITQIQGGQMWLPPALQAEPAEGDTTLETTVLE